MAFERELAKETINSPLVCLQGVYRMHAMCARRPPIQLAGRLVSRGRIHFAHLREHPEPVKWLQSQYEMAQKSIRNGSNAKKNGLKPVVASVSRNFVSTRNLWRVSVSRNASNVNTKWLPLLLFISPEPRVD